MCLGLSQKEFGEKLGATKDWFRHTESTKNKIIHRAIAARYTDKIQNLFVKKPVTSDYALKNWNNYMFHSKDQVLPEPEIELKQISKMTEEDLKKYFILIKDETKDFTKFDIDLLKRIPQSILILRIVLGIDHRKFAKMLNINDRGLRKYESLNSYIKPQTASKIVEVLNVIFKRYNQNDIYLEKALENFRILKGFYGHRNLDSMTNHGLTYLAKTQSIIENEVYALLNSANIPVERNCIIDGINKKFNVDLAIPNISQPKIVIECFLFRKSITTRNWKFKAQIIDHRFQALKMKNSNLITIMVVKSTGRPILDSYVKKAIQVEILNTDYFLINKEIERLPDLIKEIMI